MGSIFISEDACAPLRNALEETGHTIYTVRSSDVVYDAISAHPDIYMCRIKNVLVIDDMIQTEPDLRNQYMEELGAKSDNFAEMPIIPALRPDDTEGHIVFEMGGIGYEYPFDVAYNAAVTDRFFIHNTEWTSPSLLDRARDAGLEIISVRQGYSKCSCVTVGSRGLITADEGIFRTVSAYNKMIIEEASGSEDEPFAGAIHDAEHDRMKNDVKIWKNAEGVDGCDETIDLLLIEKGHVALEGFEYGFLGGASGCVEDTVYFNGDLSVHPDFERIRDFIRAHGYSLKYFEGETLADIGSIIYLP